MSCRIFEGLDVNDDKVSMRRLLKTHDLLGYPQIVARLEVFFLSRAGNLRYGGFPCVGLPRQKRSGEYCRWHRLVWTVARLLVGGCALGDHGEKHVFYTVDGATRYQFELAGRSS